MSWFDRPFRLLGLALGAALLSGCNVGPMYGPFAVNPAVLGDLQAIEVAPIPERLGHYVRNELIFALNGTGAQVAPRYRLIVTLKEQVRTPIIDTVTQRATSATVIVDAAYRLVSLPEETEIASGVAENVASYDRFSNRLSNVRAARDAETRDAKTIADEIRTRISIALTARG
ncbi:MAG TPA: LPS assembly lipoprotein LptE [Methylocystis sp.]|nr:LPS assembly lipoprotein LptE [Methylocystis sp.]